MGGLVFATYFPNIEKMDEDMYWIYDKLGNAVDHELTIKFIESGYDLELLYPQKGDAYEGE